MKKHQFIIGTAGHVDHGKSALVKALTGTDPDRLPEEKARGITIDLGFAGLNLAGPNGDNIHAGIIDVPGHEDFVRNMIAGVGSIDLALFVVAADDGWMPQSEEHLQILTYLGVRRAVITLTKIDLGGRDIVTAQIRNQLRETSLANAPIIPTSVRSGEGIENLKAALACEFATMQPQRDYGKPRLFIDRVFTLRGIGTVVTGTLTGGELRRGQRIVVQPGNFEARIRSIQSHGVELETAHPGMRTALNLPDISVEQIKRGDVVTVVDLGQASATLLVRLETSIRVSRAHQLKRGSSVYLHHGTLRVAARISSLEKNGVAQVKLASHIFAFLGDRFVIRDPSERHTIGGGIVLDPDGGAPQHKFLTVRGDVDLWGLSEIAARGFVRKDLLLRKSHFSSDEIAETFERLERANTIVIHGEIAADTAAWEQLRREAIDLIDRAHQQHPERAGLDLSELRGALSQQSFEIFDALIIDLCQGEFVRAGSTISKRTHQSSLPPELKAAADKIHAALSAKPFDPPSRKDLLKHRHLEQALHFLVEHGEMVEISDEIVLTRNSVDQMRATVSDFISANGPATVSQLREKIGTSRRVIIPFLEYLDRTGMTRRIGDERVLAKKESIVKLDDAETARRT